MRTIHADLKTAQEANLTPYIYIAINDVDGGGAVNYGTANATNPLISLEHIEEPYRDRATIVLGNSNRGLDPGALDLRGSSFSIGYGYKDGNSVNRYCGDGDGTAGTPTLWVKSQQAVSMEGKAVCILQCEGMWMKLRELSYLAVGSAPYYDTPYGGTQTIKELIVLALDEATMTVNATWEDDSIIDDFQPYLTINDPPYENLANLLYRLIRMTKCYLRPEAALVHKIIYPQTSDSANEVYYSYQAPYFLEYTEKRNLPIPNDIKVFWGYDSDSGIWDATALASPGSAVNQTSIDAYTTVRECYLAPDITSEADADNRAAAILARYGAETLAGRLILPYHDCSVELYDRVQVLDSRGY